MRPLTPSSPNASRSRSCSTFSTSAHPDTPASLGPGQGYKPSLTASSSTATIQPSRLNGNVRGLKQLTPVPNASTSLETQSGIPNGRTRPFQSHSQHLRCNLLKPWLNTPTESAVIHPISQVAQPARALPPPYPFAAVYLADESQAGGDTRAKCIRRWEGRSGCGEKEVESPTWGKVVE